MEKQIQKQAERLTAQPFADFGKSTKQESGKIGVVRCDRSGKELFDLCLCVTDDRAGKFDDQVRQPRQDQHQENAQKGFLCKKPLRKPCRIFLITQKYSAHQHKQ